MHKLWLTSWWCQSWRAAHRPSLLYLNVFIHFPFKNHNLCDCSFVTDLFYLFTKIINIHAQSILNYFLFTLKISQRLIIFYVQFLFLYKWFILGPCRAFKTTLKISKTWNLYVGAKDTNINIWVTLKIAQMSFIFYKCLEMVLSKLLYRVPWHRVVISRT